MLKAYTFLHQWPLSGGTSWSACCPRYTDTRRSNRVSGRQSVQEGDVDIDVDIDAAIDMLMWLEAFRPVTNAKTYAIHLVTVSLFVR